MAFDYRNKNYRNNFTAQKWIWVWTFIFEKLYYKYISCKNGGVFMTHEQFEKADRNLSVWRKTKMYVLPFTISMMDLAV